MNSLPDRLRRIQLLCPVLAAITFCILLVIFRLYDCDSDRFSPKELQDKVLLAIESLDHYEDVTQSTDTNQRHIVRIAGNNAEKQQKLTREITKLNQLLLDLFNDGTFAYRYILDTEKLADKVEHAQDIVGTRWSIAYTAIRQLGKERTLGNFKLDDYVGHRSGRGEKRLKASLATVFDQNNPWGGIPGRILLADPGLTKCTVLYGPALQHKDRKKPAVVEPAAARGLDMPSLRVLNGSLARYLLYDYSVPRRSEVAESSPRKGRVQKSLVVRNNKVDINGKEVPVGYDVVLTVDPSLQLAAQKLVDQTLADGAVENVVLMAMDIDSGEILVSAEGENFVSDADKTPLIFREFMPASTTKIIFAAAMLEHKTEFMRHSSGAARQFSELPDKVQKSITPYFQRLALNFDAARYFKTQADRFGWNGDCGGDGNCGGGIIDYLFGADVLPSASASPPYPLQGRIFVQPTGRGAGTGFTPLSLMGLPGLEAIADPNHRPANVTQPHFDAAKIVKTQVAGQGDCRTSPWGELLLMAHVIRAANGHADVPLPHLVREVRNAGWQPVSGIPMPRKLPVAMSRDNASLLAGYLARVNFQGGTAGENFRGVFGRYAVADDLVIAKTGTTDFEHDATPYRLYLASYARKTGKAIDTALISVVLYAGARGKAERLNKAAELALRFIKQTKS